VGLWAGLVWLAVAVPDGFEDRLEEILQALADDAPEARASGRDRLRDLILAADPEVASGTLRRRAAAAADPEVRASLWAALDLVNPLRLRIELLERPRLGAAIRFQASVTNVGHKPVPVVPLFRKSDGGLHFPMYDVSLFGPDGWCPRGKDGVSSESLQRECFVTLKPGESAVVVQEGAWPNCGRDPAPDRPGSWKLVVTCDFSSRELWRWAGPVPDRDDELAALVAAIPKVCLEASLELDVQP
jgi:hypothetical protein